MAFGPIVAEGRFSFYGRLDSVPGAGRMICPGGPDRDVPGFPESLRIGSSGFKKRCFDYVFLTVLHLGPSFSHEKIGILRFRVPKTHEKMHSLF